VVFLSPPVAISAFYLKGMSPPDVTLNQIFDGMMPYVLVVILCMVIMYVSVARHDPVAAELSLWQLMPRQSAPTCRKQALCRPWL